MKLSERMHTNPTVGEIDEWRDEVAQLEEENERLMGLLDNSRKCIRSVEDKSIFGIGESDGMSRWYLADELLSYIDDALKEGG